MTRFVPLSGPGPSWDRRPRSGRRPRRRRRLFRLRPRFEIPLTLALAPLALIVVMAGCGAPAVEDAPSSESLEVLEPSQGLAAAPEVAPSEAHQGSPAPEPGRYGVVAVDGAPLPALLAPSWSGEGECTRRLSGGVLELTPEGAFALSLELHERCPAQSTASAQRIQGTYASSVDRIRLTPDDGQEPFEGALEPEDRAIILSAVGAQLRFRRGALGRVDMDAILQAEAEAAAERRLEAFGPPRQGYSCTEDPLLDEAPALPVSDTAGIGVRIEEHFPAWRLSTQHEIGCRFPLLDGTRPEMYWGEAWGTGRAWWIWPGDFNGDGQEDRLVLLTYRENPARDLLVVLFADGSAAQVDALGGWGVRVGPEAGTRLGGWDDSGPAETLVGEGITIDFWEKAATIYYWSDGAFHSHTPRG